MVPPDTRGATNAAQGDMLGWLGRDIFRLAVFVRAGTHPHWCEPSTIRRQRPMQQGALRPLRVLSE